MNLTGDRNKCCGCNEFFNSTAAFDKHRVGEFGSPHDPRRCLKVTEMVAKGMTKNADGWWITKPNPLFQKESQ